MNKATLEFFVKDSHNLVMSRIDKKDFNTVLQCYEPYREKIEKYLNQYDITEHDWRTYSDRIFRYIPEEVLRQANQSVSKLYKVPKETECIPH